MQKKKKSFQILVGYPQQETNAHDRVYEYPPESDVFSSPRDLARNITKLRRTISACLLLSTTPYCYCCFCYRKVRRAMMRDLRPCADAFSLVSSTSADRPRPPHAHFFHRSLPCSRMKCEMSEHASPRMAILPRLLSHTTSHVCCCCCCCCCRCRCCYCGVRAVTQRDLRHPLLLLTAGVPTALLPQYHFSCCCSL